MKFVKAVAKKIKGFNLTFNWVLFFIMVIMFIAIACMNSAFLYPDYIIGVMLRNIVEIGLIALPMTLIIITGGIDLSVGSILVLSAMVGGIAAAHYGPFAGLLATLLTGFACGLFNGILIAKVKISPFIATIATMYLFLGIARGISAGNSVYSYSIPAFFGTTQLGGIPFQLYLFIVFAAAFYFILAKTTLGRKLYGIGLNENATKYAGINTDRVKMIIYITSGLICALSSLIWLGRFTSIKYDAGTNLNLTVVTVIVLGGTSILGGSGNMGGTIIGTLIMAILNSGLTVLNIPISTQIIVHGVVLVVSLIAFAYLNERVKRSKIIKIGVQENQTRTQ